MTMTPPAPVGLLAELTHRCPLGCPYCSNPLALEGREGELATGEWKRVFSEAAALGVLQVHLSGGEPLSRRDLTEIVRHCASLGLYTNLITSGIGMNASLVKALAEAGLDHVQLSIQDADAASADKIAGYAGAFAKKQEVAALVTAEGFPLTVNAVIHRANAARAGAMLDLAVALGARRVEIAHVQYYGWAVANRGQLMPDRAAAAAAVAEVEQKKRELAGIIVVDHVIPDYHARLPKACMGGWGRRTLNITPTGKGLPCHAAETLKHLTFWNVRDASLSDIWYQSPGFNAYRGTAWMNETCRSCERRDIDHGGCRCQALALAGDAAATDPVCHKSPDHARLADILAAETQTEPAPYHYRRVAARGSA
ncbi:MAG: pyrroloquinoline quinone biosynthesis protein PqqE [Hyphomicrobiales bacterium]|nr:pyrroloquinoline quinone biosynthesis protein PqqE [Hyphomicrobiales bacterium]